MTINKLAIYGVLGLTYLGLALGYVPGFRMNRATIALVGSSCLITLGVLSLQQAWDAIDSTTIVFLLSMMVINANLSYAGFFPQVLSLLLRFTRSPLGILIALTFGSGILSAFFLNDTLVLIFTPFTISLTQALRLNPIPYLLAMAGATNIGSVATLSGNPQNILIGSFSGIGFLDFMRALAPVAVTGLAIQVILLCLLYPNVRSTVSCTQLSIRKHRIFKPLFHKTLIITSGLLIAFVAGLPVAESALVAASLLLITRRVKPQRILKKVDWNLLVMFSGLFILSRVTQQLNLLKPFTYAVNSSAGLLGVTAILSNMISNVPAVLLLQSLIPRDDTQSWLLLAAGSTLAGNLTLFGSVANLIVVEAAAELGYQLTFVEHLRFGVPITLLTLLLVFLWIH
ncbi:MAG: anion transporter [Chlorogloeopsis fritschii C42_A2020_084]|uniref:anion transporter n=1 Tax=Chlorogloeopsis fritschii TaxID=1124 RepID=UPI0019E49237|nr:anion transporter [Chlorogloeopsis fritschii]MBF2004655.1 anion transporter [Chlorogloeopsis fritschii C42_A2020_084]